VFSDLLRRIGERVRDDRRVRRTHATSADSLVTNASSAAPTDKASEAGTKEKPMRHLVIVLISLTAACVADEPSDPDPSSVRDRPSTAQNDPATCHQACEVALGICEIASFEDRQLLESCTKQCPFDADELRCLAAESCGSDPACE
jgi:hypothetical protein